MKYKIEKNVPMPARTREPGRSAKYPWHEMDVGDSFAIPLEGKKGSSGSKYYKWDAATRKLTNAATFQTQRTGEKYSVRELKKEGVARVWRVK